MDFFWPGVLGEPKAVLVFCNSKLSLAKKEKKNMFKRKKDNIESSSV